MSEILLLLNKKNRQLRYGPEATFTRASVAYNSALQQVASGLPRIESKGVMVEEGTTNLLQAGAENFVTGWTNGTGETCTVTDYPMYIEGIGDVVAKRITGNGLGSNIYKRYTTYTTGIANPHTSTVSCWCMSLNPAKNFYISDTIGSSTIRTLIPTTMTRISSTQNVSSNLTSFGFLAPTITDIIDIVVYAPQIEAKSYATSYTPPGTTRAAETLSIPVGAYQKNLLTLNQATGGDTLGGTTGFTAVNGATVTRDTTEAWQGTGSIKVVTPGSVAGEGVRWNPTLIIGKVYTQGIRIKGSGTITLNYSGNSSVSSSTITLGSEWTLIQLPAACDLASHFWKVRTVTAQSATFYIDGLQLEEGTTASDFVLPSTDYSNAIIDPAQPFSIEFDYVPTSDNKSALYYLFGLGDANNYIHLATNITTGYYRAFHRYASGTIRQVLSSTAGAVGIKKSHKISVTPSTSQFIYTLDGIDVGTGTLDGIPSLLGMYMYWGTSANGAAHRNGYISNVRIRKGVALSAAERAYTGRLYKDSHTTFLRNWRG